MEKKKVLNQFRDFGIGAFIGIIISMITVPVTTRLVSPDEFGKSSLFTLVQTLFLLFGVLGLDSSFVRCYNEQNDKRKLFYNSLFVPVLFCSILLFVSIGLFRHELSLWLFNQYEPIIVWLFIVFFPAVLIQRLALICIRMELRGKLYSLLNIIAQITNFLFLLFFLLVFEASFRSIIYATIISTVINTCIALFCIRHIGHFYIKYFDFKLMKRLLRYGLPLVPANILTWIVDSFDKIGLRSWSSYEELGLYAAAFKIVALLTMVQNIFTTVWIPIAYKWHENRESTDRFEKVSVLVLGVMTIIMGGTIIFRDIILLFLGAEYRNISIIFVYLLFVPVLYTISETTTLGIPFSNRTEYYIVVSLACAGISILGNYFLIPILGAKGAAISAFVSYMSFFWIKTFLSRRLWYKFGLLKYIVVFTALCVLVFAVELNVHKIIEVFILLSIILVNYIFIKKQGIKLSTLFVS